VKPIVRFAALQREANQISSAVTLAVFSLEERVGLLDDGVSLHVETNVVLRDEEVLGGGHLLPVQQGGVAVGQVPLPQIFELEVLVQTEAELVA